MGDVRTVKITADTNVLVRAAVPATTVGEDATQADRARALLAGATLIAVTTATLCEFVWALRRGYGYSAAEVAGAIDALCAVRGVVVDAPQVEAGLMMLRAGGDFADGVIVRDGEMMGAETFCSFDRKAVRLLRQSGISAQEA